MNSKELEGLKANCRDHFAKGLIVWIEPERILSLISSYEERGKALERFGRVADHWIDAAPDDDPVVLCDLGGSLDEEWDLTIGDFRKARSLSPTDKGGSF